MNKTIALIGFGEAGRTFAHGGNWREAAHVFDIKTQDAASAPAMRAAYAEAIAKGYRFYSYGDACLLLGGRTL